MPISPPSHAKHVWQGNVIQVYAWDQALYDGTLSQFECITRPDTASVIAFLDPETVLLTRQYQPHKADPFLDFPGGRIEKEENHTEGALRELREETGYSAGRIHEWYRHSQRGVSRFEELWYIATDLTQSHDVQHDPGERIELIPTPWRDVVDMCLKRHLRQMNSMLAVLQMEFHPEMHQRLHDWLHK